MVGSAVTWSDAKSPLERATVALDSSARGALATWIELLCTWNARIDLTAARSNGELVDLMVVDALVLASQCIAEELHALYRLQPVLCELPLHLGPLVAVTRSDKPLSKAASAFLEQLKSMIDAR